MLGRLRVEGAGGAALPRRARQVLGVLAARHDRLVTKDALADAVWGDDLPGNHVAALEQYVSLLRKTLQPGRGRAGSFIVTGDGGYRFSTERAALDLAELRAATRRAEELPPGSAARLADRQRVLDLVEGPPFEQEDTAWAAAVRLEVREATQAALVELGETAVGTAPERALRLARTAVEADGYLERAYRIAMRAAAALGRHDEALRWYQRCRATLSAELGLEPAPETRRLYRELVGLRPVAPRATDPVPFAGRAAELELILADPPVRILHLAGPPGAGKSAVLAELVRRAPGRVGTGTAAAAVGPLRLSWLRSALAQLGAGEPLLALLDAVAAGSRTLTRPELEDLAVPLDRAGPVLLAIDDAQELDAGSVAELAWLHQRCPRLGIVAAYRYPHALAGRPLGALPADLVLRLAPLNPEEIGDAAYERSGGIPALVCVADRPAGVGRAVAMHVARLRTAWMPGGAWDVLRLCAALGTLRVEQLARLTGTALPEVLDHVDRLVHAHLLAEGPGGHVRHRSGLVRDAVAEQLSTAHATHLRDRLASA